MHESQHKFATEDIYNMAKEQALQKNSEQKLEQYSKLASIEEAKTPNNEKMISNLGFETDTFTELPGKNEQQDDKITDNKSRDIPQALSSKPSSAKTNEIIK